MRTWRVRLRRWRSWLAASSYGLFVVAYGCAVTGRSLLGLLVTLGHELGLVAEAALGVPNPITAEALHAWVTGEGAPGVAKAAKGD